MRPLTAVLFDAGNVLLDIDAGLAFRAWAHAAGTDADTLRRRWTIDDAYARHETGHLSFEDYTRHLGTLLGIELSLDDWRSGWNAIFRGTFAPVVARLPELGAALPLYVYTNTNPTHQQVWARDHAEVLVHFEKVYVSSEIGRRKPHPEAFLWVAEDMGHAPAQVLFIDDTRANIEGAARAGFQTCHVAGPEDTLAAIDYALKGAASSA